PAPLAGSYRDADCDRGRDVAPASWPLRWRDYRVWRSATSRDDRFGKVGRARTAPLACPAQSRRGATPSDDETLLAGAPPGRPAAPRRKAEPPPDSSRSGAGWAPRSPAIRWKD